MHRNFLLPIRICAYVYSNTPGRHTNNITLVEYDLAFESETSELPSRTKLTYRFSSPYIHIVYCIYVCNVRYAVQVRLAV